MREWDVTFRHEVRQNEQSDHPTAARRVVEMEDIAEHRILAESADFDRPPSLGPQRGRSGERGESYRGRQGLHSH
jgi:hypothetical protein